MQESTASTCDFAEPIWSPVATLIMARAQPSSSFFLKQASTTAVYGSALPHKSGNCLHTLSNTSKTVSACASFAGYSEVARTNIRQAIKRPIVSRPLLAPTEKSFNVRVLI